MTEIDKNKKEQRALEIIKNHPRSQKLLGRYNTLASEGKRGFIDRIFLMQKTLAYVQAQKLATTDTMTGLLNRRGLLDKAGALWSFLGRQRHDNKNEKESRKFIGVVFFDLDYFKKINDTYGHDAGDYVLKEVAATAKKSLNRGTDILGRWGGEEFVLVMTAKSHEEVIGTAEKVRIAIKENRFEFDGKVIPVTTSLGVTLANPNGHKESLEQSIKIADSGLYAAKEGGRNRAVYTNAVIPQDHAQKVSDYKKVAKRTTRKARDPKKTKRPISSERKRKSGIAAKGPNKT